MTMFLWCMVGILVFIYIRNELVYSMRRKAALYLYENLPSKYGSAAIWRQTVYDDINKEYGNYYVMLFSFHKWTFQQFFPNKIFRGES